MKLRKGEFPPLTWKFLQCKNCLETKDEAYFKYQKGIRVGLVCRKCSNEMKLIKNFDEAERQRRNQKAREYQNKNKEAIAKRAKAYRNENSDAIKAGKKEYHKNNSEKINARSIAWYEQNKETVSVKYKEKYAENREKLCAKGRKNYKNNKEAYKENNRLWRLNNPRATTAYVRQYNLAKMNRTPQWANIKEINKFYRKCPIGLQVDHIHPLQGRLISGLHVLENLQYLTKEENVTKSNRFYPYLVTYEQSRIRVETSGPEASIYSIVY